MKPASILIPALLLSALASPPAAQAFDGCRAADVDRNGVVNFNDVYCVINSYGSSDPTKDLDGSLLVDLPDALIVVDFFQLGCPSCPGDLDENGVVDAADRALLETAIEDPPDCRFDVTRDGIVDGDEDVDTCIYYFQNPISPATLRCDFDGNGIVNFNDVFRQILAEGTDCRFDVNKDGAVTKKDIWALLSYWGVCPESL